MYIALKKLRQTTVYRSNQSIMDYVLVLLIVTSPVETSDGKTAVLTQDFVAYPNLFRTMLVYYVKIDHDHFFLHPSQYLFITSDPIITLYHLYR
jgi:hypothetical protein